MAHRTIPVVVDQTTTFDPEKRYWKLGLFNEDGSPFSAGEGGGGVGPAGPAGADGRTIHNGAGTPSGGLGANGDIYINTTANTYYVKAGGSWGSPVSLVGPAGATGETGAAGAAGATGATGAAGADGRTIYNGSGAPSGGLGANGDIYIDTTAHTYYVKAGGSWGSSTSLIGPTGSTGAAGAAGADGRTIYNGAGAPSGGLGANGDIYIDTTAHTYYVKAGGSWGSSTSLVGPTGATGATGATGSAGATGSTGAAGADGKTIHNGAGTPSGGLGVNGDIYINTSANTYYVKAAGSWGSPVSLVGPTGSTGSTGAAGADGKTIHNGAGTPSGGLGVNGDIYINTTANTYYIKAAGSWGSPVSLVGPTGETGAAGSDALAGYVDSAKIESDFDIPASETDITGLSLTIAPTAVPIILRANVLVQKRNIVLGSPTTGVIFLYITDSSNVKIATGGGDTLAASGFTTIAMEILIPASGSSRTYKIRGIITGTGGKVTATTTGPAIFIATRG